MDAIRKFREFAELSADERKALKGPVCRFLEKLLETGSIAEADEALETKGRFAAIPGTLGAKALQGMVELDFNPYEFRDRAHYAIEVLFLLAKQDGDSSVLPWIAQGLKLAFNAERRPALGALYQLSPSLDDEQVELFADDYVTSLLSQEYSDLLTPAWSLRDLLNYLPDPRWPLGLARALAKHPATFTDKLDRLSFDIDEPAGASGPALKLPPAELLSLATEVRDPKSAAQAQCLIVALWRAGLKPEAFAEALLKRAETVRAPSLAATLAGWLSVERVSLSANARTRFEALLARYQVAVEYDKREAIEAIEALLKNPGFAPEGLSRVFIRPMLQFGPGRFAAPYQRVLFHAPETSWRTHEDELGLILIDVEKREHRLERLPALFASRPTGAAGHRRGLQPLAVDAHASQLFLGISSPFGREKSWGTENYVVSFDLRNGVWSNWRATEGKDQLLPHPLSKTLTPEEEALVPICFGELAVKADPSGRVTLFSDSTPYHLDDYPDGNYLRPLPPPGEAVSLREWKEVTEAQGVQLTQDEEGVKISYLP